MLATSSSVLPLSAAIALQPAFVVASLGARLFFFWRHIDWRIVTSFVLGCLIGVVPGALLFSALNDAVIAIILGIFLLLLIWWPAVEFKIPFKYPFFPIGALHSMLGVLFGAGAVLQPSILRTSLSRLQITGTLAGCLLVLDFMKLVSYVSLGFSYQQYFLHILFATLAGFSGTWVGKVLAHKVSEQFFRTVYKWVISLIAIRLVLKGFSGL